jgi:hypothetical protein
MSEFIKYLAVIAFGLCMGVSIGSFTSLVNPNLSVPWESFQFAPEETEPESTDP